ASVAMSARPSPGGTRCRAQPQMMLLGDRGKRRSAVEVLRPFELGRGEEPEMMGHRSALTDRPSSWRPPSRPGVVPHSAAGPIREWHASDCLQKSHRPDNMGPGCTLIQKWGLNGDDLDLLESHTPSELRKQC